MKTTTFKGKEFALYETLLRNKQTQMCMNVKIYKIYYCVLIQHEAFGMQHRTCMYS